MVFNKSLSTTKYDTPLSEYVWPTLAAECAVNVTPFESRAKIFLKLGFKIISLVTVKVNELYALSNSLVVPSPQ